MKKNETQHYIAFDIDSSSIGVLVFERRQTKKGDYLHHEVFSRRQNIGKGFRLEFPVFFAQTQKVFHELALLAHRYSGSNIADIYVNLSSPWVSTQKHIYHYEKEKPFVCTQEIIDSLLEKGSQIKTSKTRDFSSYSDLKLLAQNPIACWVNGYKVKNILGKQGKSIKTNVLNTYISDQSFQTFTEIIQRHFHRDPIFTANTFVEYKNYLRMFPDQKEVLFIDMSAELTDITLIQKGEIIRTGTLSCGSHTIMRTLADELSVSLSKARSLISLYNTHKLEEQFEKKITESMERSFLLWFKELYAALVELDKEYLIPQKILLVTDTFMNTWLLFWLRESDEMSQLLAPQQSIEILDVHQKILDKHIAQFDDAPDASLLNLLMFLEEEIFTVNQKKYEA